MVLPIDGTFNNGLRRSAATICFGTVEDLDLLAALYSVVVMALPAYTTIDTSMIYGDPPKTAAISRSGSVAFILKAARAEQDNSRILVVRANGSRVVLDLPVDSVLAQTFKHYALGPSGERRFPSKRFTAVTLADDGTPFVTVSALFFGAFSGVDQGVFFWNGKWQNAYASGVPFETGNVDVVAALSINTFVANANYLNYFPGPIDGQPRHYQEDQIVSTTTQSGVLGFGDATAMRGPFVVGVVPGRQTIVAPATAPVVAMKWLGNQGMTLGPGIARSVNATGIVVGDESVTRNARRLATIWPKTGKTYHISSVEGSAYAIDDDGTIVGELDRHGFISRWNGRTAKARRFDDLLVDRRWRIIVALGMANSGDVLALGRLGSRPPVFVLLRPRAVSFGSGVPLRANARGDVQARRFARLHQRNGDLRSGTCHRRFELLRRLRPANGRVVRVMDGNRVRRTDHRAGHRRIIRAHRKRPAADADEGEIGTITFADERHVAVEIGIA